jgi:uncharacterized membrane protein
MDSHAKSILKAVSWRIVGSMDTFILSWIITGTPAWAFTIASTELLTKVILFWVHERVWGRIKV